MSLTKLSTGTLISFPVSHLQILLLQESLSRYLTYPSTLTLNFPLHHLLIDAYRPEFADNNHQGPAETHNHSPVVIPLPSFVDVIASIPIHHTPSMSSLKNGNIGNPIETQSVFALNFFGFVSSASFLFAAKFSLFPLARPSDPSIYRRPILKYVRVILCLFLLPSIRLPNRRLPTETLALGSHILIQDFRYFTL